MGSVASPLTFKKKKKETLVNILPTKKRPEPKSNSELDQIFRE